MSVLRNWADSQVKRLSRATGQSSHAMVWSWTTHVRSSHAAAQSLGQMSVLCCWAAQPPDGMVKPVGYQNLWPGNAVTTVVPHWLCISKYYIYAQTHMYQAQDNDPGECHASDMPIRRAERHIQHNTQHKCTWTTQTTDGGKVGEGEEGGRKARGPQTGGWWCRRHRQAPGR